MQKVGHKAFAAPRSLLILPKVVSVTNTRRVFHIEMMWKRGFHVVLTWNTRGVFVIKSFTCHRHCVKSVRIRKFSGRIFLHSD